LRSPILDCLLYYGYGTAWGLLPFPPSEGWPKAEAALAKVMELDDTLPEVKTLTSGVKLVNYRDWTPLEKGLSKSPA
jgi:hypothetical protein